MSWKRDTVSPLWLLFQCSLPKALRPGEPTDNESIQRVHMRRCLSCLGLTNETKYNKIPQAGWLTNNRKVCLTALQAGKSKNEMPADAVSGEGMLPGSQTGLFAVLLRGGRGKGALWGLFCKKTTLLHEVSTSWPNHLPNVPPPNTITLRIGFNVRIWGDTKIQSITEENKKKTEIRIKMSEF